VAGIVEQVSREAQPVFDLAGVVSTNQKNGAGRHLARGYSASTQGAQTFIQVNGCAAAVMAAGQGAWMVADMGYDAFASRWPRAAQIDSGNNGRPYAGNRPGQPSHP
jgi:hypothetical protein